MSTRACILMMSLLVFSGRAFAQADEKEPVAIAEIGGAAAQSLTGGGASGGGAVAVEFTPIENRLEMEAGVTALFSHSTEWDADLLFKKPWTFSKKAEFMLGAGPEWIHTSENHISANAVGAEGILDFMFWPTGKHRFGWYLEPGYDYSFGRGHDQSLGISGGLLIAIP